MKISMREILIRKQQFIEHAQVKKLNIKTITT